MGREMEYMDELPIDIVDGILWIKRKDGWYMTEKIAEIFLLLVIISLFCAAPASGAINTISQGNAVFIGEEGLDISLAMGSDTQVGWWASAADISSSSPTTIIDLKTRMTSFMAGQSEFSGNSGSWYRLNGAGKADGIAFTIVDPQLDLKVEDATASVDVEKLKWIPTGDDIRFRIDTNLAQIAAQRSAPPLITIKVQAPDGVQYTSLYNGGGTPVSIEDIPVTTRPFYTDALWNMGNHDRYPPGTYTVWAECNVNKMNDNYGATGKTTSEKFSLLNQGPNPLIRTTPPTTQETIQTTPASPTLTTMNTGKPTTITIVTTLPVPTTTTPLTSPIKEPGFESMLAVASLLVGLLFFMKKE